MPRTCSGNRARDSLLPYFSRHLPLRLRLCSARRPPRLSGARCQRVPIMGGQVVPGFGPAPPVPSWHGSVWHPQREVAHFSPRRLAITPLNSAITIDDLRGERGESGGRGSAASIRSEDPARHKYCGGRPAGQKSGAARAFKDGTRRCRKADVTPRVRARMAEQSRARGRYFRLCFRRPVGGILPWR